MLLAAVIATVGYIVLTNTWPLLVFVSPAGSLLETTLMWLATACGAMEPFLLGYGLLRSRVVAVWVGWIALAWGAARGMVILISMSLLLGPISNLAAPDWLRWVTLALNVAFFVALGVSLLTAPRPAALDAGRA